MEGLRAEYTEVWCAGQNTPLALFADRAMSIAASGLDRLGILPAEDVVERLRSFDAIVSWYGANRPEFRALVMDELRLPFVFLPALPSPGTHAVEFFNQQARALGANPSRYPHIDIPTKPRTFAAIHPFASGPAKRAPMAVFESIAAKFGREMPVHWLAGPEEVLDRAIRIENLYDLAGWLAGARVFVGNDSGIGHLAAAVGTPVLTLFRRTDRRMWTPRGLAVTNEV